MIRTDWLIAGILMAVLCGQADAGEWSWQWNADAQAHAAKAEVCPFKYGKDWAYSVEIDDNPMTALTVAQPLLARFQYTDAPPGIRGGHELPFVGGVAVIVGSIGTSNPTVLQWNDLRTLRKDGWGVISHSYYHQGHSYGNPPQILSAEQFRTDLFWSQAILAAHAPNGRAPTSLVYPNGYTDYAKYMGEFGILAGSRVSGGPNNPMYNDKFNFANLTRSYLDEGYWSHSGKGQPMAMFPKNGPKEGMLHIDFTHGISAKPDSDNFKRWTERLTNIAAEYGAKGKDNLWCAPTGDVVDYVTAAKSAKLTIKPGRLSVSIPDDVPGASLTFKLTGIHSTAKLEPPAGGVLYRDGDTVWVTSPMIGLPGASSPNSRVKQFYSGAVKDLTFDHPISIAAVRLLYTAPPAADFKFVVDAMTESGVKSLVPPDFKNPTGAWNKWQLFSTVPNVQPIVARGLHVQKNPASLQAMEVWIVAEDVQTSRKP